MGNEKLVQGILLGVNNSFTDYLCDVFDGLYKRVVYESCNRMYKSDYILELKEPSQRYA